MTDIKHESKQNASHTPAPWRYEASTQTIRSVPTNYWIATLGSFDGAVNHTANAHLIAAAPKLLEALEALSSLKVRGHALIDRLQFSSEGRALAGKINAALTQAKGLVA